MWARGHAPAAALLLLALLSGLRAQNAATAEISGVVREFGGDATTLPVAGARVALFDNRADVALAITFTDANGAFQFHAPHPGDYIVELSKEGYSPQGSGDLSVTLGPEGRPSAPLSFYLNRPGELTGRVADEDGQPVAGLQVTLQRAGAVNSPGTTAVTASDGTFAAGDLRPGPYLVRISPRSGDDEKIVPKFTQDDLNTVDEDFETTYWPGGFPEPSASIPVSPGASANIGTIKIRKAPYYRVYASVAPVDCSPGESWAFSIFDSGTASNIRNEALQFSSDIPCTKDFLVRNLRPGSYWFILRKNQVDPGRWALASVDVSTKNLDVALDLEPDAEIAGRVIAAADATLPPLEKIGVSTKLAVGGFLSGAGSPATPDPEGNFTLTGLKFPNHQILLNGLPTQYYVKEMRFNGAPSPDGLVTLSQGPSNELEIVIDDKPGTVIGAVIEDGKPATQSFVILFTPSLRPALAPELTHEGRFQFNGVAPGEYRVIAVPLLALRPENIEEANRLASLAKPITVERGGAVNISIKLTDPSR